MSPYVEQGATWRAFWGVAAALLAVPVLDAALPGPGVPPWLWALALVGVLGPVAAGTLSARRIWTLRVDERALAVGREAVPLADVDPDHLASVDSGVDAGAPLLGGGWSLPKGRTGLPLRLTDGRTVLVATRDPAALRAAVLLRRGTLGS
jgi:hypothetical protein